MTAPREWTDYLEDIVSAIEKIERFAGGMHFQDFAHDEKTVFAIIRALEIIGEAAKGVPEAMRSGHPDIPWKEMAATRDKLIHAYSGVDLEVVWNTIQQDLPPLKTGIVKLLAEVSGRPGTM